MFVKKFEANSMEEALAQIKRELGPNALILSTEQRRGNWLKKSMVEVTAALEKRKKETPSDEGFDEKDLAKVFPHRREKEVREVVETARRQAVSKYAEAEPEPAEKSGKKDLVPSRQAERFENGFVELGFSQEAAREFARRLVFDYSKKDLSHASFLQRARVKLVAGSMRTLGPDVFDAKDSWVFLGLPGSGKTSLLVKLALHLRGQKRQLQMVSVDSRKISGRSELGSYAKLVKVPFHAEVSPIASGKLQLVDAPSLSFHGQEEAEELEKLCARRNSVLVLDATVRLQELLRTIEHARRYNPTALAFTRLDLISQAGVIYDVLKTSKLPLLGLSLSRAFTTPFKFLEPAELASFLLK